MRRTFIAFNVVMTMVTTVTAAAQINDSANEKVVVNCTAQVFNYHSSIGTWDHPCTSPTTPWQCSTIPQTMTVDKKTGWSISDYEFRGKLDLGSGTRADISLSRQTGLVSVQWLDPDPNPNHGFNTVTGYCVKAGENKF